MLCCGFKSKDQKREVEEDNKVAEKEGGDVIKCESPTNTEKQDVTEPVTEPLLTPNGDTEVPDLSVSTPAGSVFDAESLTTKDSEPPATAQGQEGAPGRPPLPRWWSQEEDEPPMPAVLGRDELALRRHRFFSADSAPLTHHVRFDPRGPTVLLPGFDPVLRHHHHHHPRTLTHNASTSFEDSGGPQDGEVVVEEVTACTIMASELESLVTRLERVTTRLESILPVGTISSTSLQLLTEGTHDEEGEDERPSSPLPPSQLSPSPSGSVASTSTASTTAMPPPLPASAATTNMSQCDDHLAKMGSQSLQEFDDILQGPFTSYLSASSKIGGDVATHAQLVDQAFKAQRAYLGMAATSRAPTASEQQDLLKPTSEKISAIQDYREKHRPSPLFNHLSAISESIPALGWVAVSPTPAPYVKEMNDAGQFYTNRVLKDWKEKDKTHVEWVHAWVQTLSELQKFVKQHHTTGLIWSGKDAPKSAGGAPPPPPPGCPPPPPVLPPIGDLSMGSGDDGSLDRSALFAEINRGDAVTKGLKKVTSDMQTHKNPNLRSGPAPFKATTINSSSTAPKAAVDKPPVMHKEGKKWMVEFQKGRKDLVIDNVEMNNLVYMFKCQDSVLTIKGKLNSVVLDSCKKTALVFDSVVSSIEFVNCQSVQMQVLGTVPTINIDKTDGCQMFLNKDSLKVEIVSSKSSEMNVMLPDSSGEFVEHPIPEQFKTTLNSDCKGITTTPVESCG